MKKQLLKSALIALAGVGLLSGSALALPVAQGPWVDYEYYQSPNEQGDWVEAGEAYSFNFDLTNLGNESTDFAGFTLENDVSGYGPYEVKNVWAAVALYSVDEEAESYSLNVNASYNGIDYAIGPLTVFVGPNTDLAWQTFKFSGALLNAWKADPSGIVTINITDYSGNDFNLVEVGVGVTPVPEPATMLLFGAGIAGLAGIVRRKK